MTLLGLDFDNTLVHYDELFHQLAVERKLIKDDFEVDKKAIREFLKKNGLEEEFTLMQGEVYGSRITEAIPTNGLLETLREINNMGISMVIVSHKTKNPYKGPPYDLHKAAWKWLEKNELTSKNRNIFTEENIFFETTKELKLKRITDLRCTHYVDDLKDIVENIPTYIDRILYDPKNTQKPKKGIKKIREWKEVIEIISKSRKNEQ